MTDQQNFSNLPSFDFFIRLFERAFNCSLDKKTVSYDPEKIEVRRLSLLLAWPGMLIMKLASITGNKEYDIQLKILKELLDTETEYQKIFDTLESLIKVNMIPEELLNQSDEARKTGDLKRLRDIRKKIRPFFPQVLETFVLLIHPKSIHVDSQIVLRDFIFSLGNYFIICCIVIKILEKKEGDTFITRDEINDIFRKFNIKDQIDIFNFSSISTNLMASIAEKDLNKIANSDNLSLIYKNSFLIPSSQLFLHQFIRDTGPNLAFIDNLDTAPDNFKDRHPTGFAIDTNLFNELDYHLWQIGIIDTMLQDNESVAGSYLFSESNVGEKDVLENLINRLYQMAKKSSLIIDVIINLWDTFVEKPAAIVEPALDKFDEWIDSLIENYETREEFFSYKSFLRAILSLDTDIKNTDFGKKRQRIITSYRKHISSELEKILTEANNEIENILDKVIELSKVEKRRVFKTSKEHRELKTEKLPEKKLLQIAQKYWKENQFQHISYDDLDFLNYTSVANKRRDGRSWVLERIATRHGKDIPKSAILKQLGYSR